MVGYFCAHTDPMALIYWFADIGPARIGSGTCGYGVTFTANLPVYGDCIVSASEGSVVTPGEERVTQRGGSKMVAKPKTESATSSLTP